MTTETDQKRSRMALRDKSSPQFNFLEFLRRQDSSGAFELCHPLLG